MDQSDKQFKNAVYKLVGSIPSGRVMTYGQIAALCGRPRAARSVGTIAHFGPEELPWHRVVNKVGNMASGYWGGKRVHGEHLSQEGVEIKNYRIVNIEKYLWRPL